MIDAVTFRQRLAETITWCKRRVDISDPKWSLRSEALKPAYDYHSPDDPPLWNDATLIQSIVDRRTYCLAQSGIAIKTSTDLNGGRLLLCYFNETNFNECSADCSRWFYDGNDNPPWDSWVGYVGDALVSWVPPQFLDLAADGMDVECCQMLMWLEKPFANVLTKEPRQIPDWLKEYSWTIPGAKNSI